MKIIFKPLNKLNIFDETYQLESLTENEISHMSGLLLWREAQWILKIYGIDLKELEAYCSIAKKDKKIIEKKFRQNQSKSINEL